MIIRWLYDDQYRDRLNDPVIASLATELLRAHRSGNHLAVIDRRMAHLLKNGPDLTARDRALLDRLSSEFSQTGNLYRQASAYIDVVPSSEASPHAIGSAIVFPANRLLASRALERPILLSENIDRDGWVYKFILQNTHDTHSCPSVDLELAHGGGEDTPTVLSHCIDNGRIVCAIVDSDKNCPDSPLSGKFSRMQRIITDSGWRLAFSYAIPCHEVENIIPHDIVITLPSGIVNPSNEIILSISHAESAGNVHADNQYWSYFDSKNGVKPDHEVNLLENEWRWIVEKLALGGIDGDAWELRGYGDRLVPQLKASNTAISEFRRMIRQSKWLAVFGNFFSDLIWIFAASRALRT